MHRTCTGVHQRGSQCWDEMWKQALCLTKKVSLTDICLQRKHLFFPKESVGNKPHLWVKHMPSIWWLIQKQISAICIDILPHVILFVSLFVYVLWGWCEVWCGGSRQPPPTLPSRLPALGMVTLSCPSPWVDVVPGWVPVPHTGKNGLIVLFPKLLAGCFSLESLCKYAGWSEEGMLVLWEQLP